MAISLTRRTKLTSVFILLKHKINPKLMQLQAVDVYFNSRLLSTYLMYPQDNTTLKGEGVSIHTYTPINFKTITKIKY